eukprot:SAG22_NODE_9349_length_594_cov_0.929293_1_plen_78_part_10
MQVWGSAVAGSSLNVRRLGAEGPLPQPAIAVGYRATLRLNNGSSLEPKLHGLGLEGYLVSGRGGAWAVTGGKGAPRGT